MDVFTGLDPDANPDELEEKQRLINQILELQNTLDGKIYSSEFFSKQLYWLKIYRIQEGTHYRRKLYHKTMI